MKKIIITLMSCVAGLTLYAQEPINPSCTCPYSSYERELAFQSDIILMVDEHASFVGGDKALKRYEQRLIQNPAKNAADSAAHNLLCRFVVEKSGKITQVELLTHTDEVFETEARRFIQTMPRWQPAKKDDKVVRSWHFLRPYFGYPEEEILPSVSENK